MKQTGNATDIEKLLQWTYRDELPKQAVGGLVGWERKAYLGFDDNPNRPEPEAQLPVALGPPHPDALALEYRVRCIEDDHLAAGGARARLLHGLGPGWPGADVAMRVETGALVAMHARMGTRPPWSMGTIRLCRVIGKNGKPVVDGLTPGRRYTDGAHCLLMLDPAAKDIMLARYEYACWHAALVTLAAESWILREHKATAPRALPEPWITGEAQSPRIWRTTAVRSDPLTSRAQTACCALGY